MFELAVLGAALFGFVALEGGRGSVILPDSRRRPRSHPLSGTPALRVARCAPAALVVAILAVAFFVRTAQHSSNAFRERVLRARPPQCAVAADDFILFISPWR